MSSEVNWDGPYGYKYYWQCQWPTMSVGSKKHLTEISEVAQCWAAISSRGSSELVFLEGKQNSLKYVETLDKYLLPLCDKFGDDAVIFKHDNAPHTHIKTDKNFSPGEEFEGSEVASSLPRLEPHLKRDCLLGRYTPMGSNISVFRN